MRFQIRRYDRQPNNVFDCYLCDDVSVSKHGDKYLYLQNLRRRRVYKMSNVN